MIHRIATKIRKRETPFYNRLYLFLKGSRHVNMPAVKIVYLPLFHLVKVLRTSFRFCVQKIFWEPLFKINCHRCGHGLRILVGMPQFSENLNIVVGDNVVLDGRNTFSATAVNEAPTLIIGSNTSVGYLNSFSAGERITIGSDCLFAPYIVICDNNGHPTAPNRRHQKVQSSEIKPVTIGNNVWIGQGAFICKGVTIGDGAVIGANSVVVSDIPANAIAGGNPARILRHFEQDDVVCLRDVK